MESDLLTMDGPGMLRFGGARMALLDIEAGFWGLRREMEAWMGGNLTHSVLAGANGGAPFARSFGETHQGEEYSVLFLGCLQAYDAAGFDHFEVLENCWPIGQIKIHANHAFEAWLNVRNSQHPEKLVCA